MQFNNILIKLLADPVIIRVYKTLFFHLEGMTGRSLAKIVETSPFKINQVLRFLEDQGLILKTVIGRSHQYRLNFKHVFIIELLPQLIQFESEILNKLGQAILQKLSPKPLSIVLYGSVARAEESAKSDIDLLLVYNNSSPLPLIAEVIESLDDLSNLYGNFPSIKIITLSVFQSPGRDHKELIRNIKKEGKAIAGISVTALINLHG